MFAKNLVSKAMKIDTFLIIVMQVVCAIWIIQTIEERTIETCQPWDSCYEKSRNSPQKPSSGS